MSDKPRDLTLERVNRLSQSILDMMEGQNAHWRYNNRMLAMIVERLDRIDTAIHALTSEQALLASRVEEAFSRALRTNIRRDEIEDAAESP